MCCNNNGIFGGNCLWIIILILILSCCGNGNGCGCSSNCGTTACC